jgi:hypothetical protein
MAFLSPDLFAFSLSLNHLSKKVKKSSAAPFFLFSRPLGAALILGSFL